MHVNENPKVNRYLHDKALDHIDHALGRPAWPMRESYRNYFATDADSTHAREFEASPHWQRGGAVGRLTYFSVTDAGRKALADHLATLSADRVYVVAYGGYEWNVPASTASKARYGYWLDIRDCLGDMTFGAFVKRSQVRLAR